MMLVVAAVGWLLAPASLPATVAGLPLGADQRQALARGETVAELLPRAAGKRVREGVALRLLEAPTERVLRAVRDHRHYTEFMPFMTVSDAHEGDEGSVVCRQRLDLPFPIPDRLYAVEGRYRQEPQEGRRAWVASWSYLPGSGNIAANDGEWVLVEVAPDRTLVAFRVYADFVPWLPAHLQDRATLRSLPWVLDGLRQQVQRCRYDDPPSAGCSEAPAEP